jgi:hypothetical protein
VCKWIIHPEDMRICLNGHHIILKESIVVWLWLTYEH